MKVCYQFILLAVLFPILTSGQIDTTIVPLNEIDSTIVQDVKYATVDNFTHQILYESDKVYLRKVVAEKLSAANKYLQKEYNLTIKIFDGYRPLSVQRKMWKIMPDSRYVANPKRGSRHNRGAAVDITLIDSNGNELAMGTEYDNFTEKAHYDYKDLTQEEKKNRKLLRDTMVKFGFEPLETEWWHFDFKGWKNFSLMDIKIN